MLSSKRYVRRIWRVPSDRGPAEYLGTAIVKALRKHGWPSALYLHSDPRIFQVAHVETGLSAGEDFWDAVDRAARIAFKAYRVDASVLYGFVQLHAFYTVAEGGHFKKEKSNA